LKNILYLFYPIKSVEGFPTTIDFAIPHRINEQFSSYFYSFKISDIIEGAGEDEVE
jgi:hypothetical protein